MKLLPIIFLLLFFHIVLLAQESEKRHAIDIKLYDCLDKEENFTTTGMLECTQKAYEDWDKELNFVYKKLRAKLTDDEKSALKKAQLEWIKFRDLEFINIDLIYDKLQGTIYIPMRLNEKVEIIKNRTLQLQAYLQLLLY